MAQNTARRESDRSLERAAPPDRTAEDAAHVELMRAFAAAWNRHDLDALMSFMAEGCVFHAAAGTALFGRTFEGAAAVREGFRMAWQTMPDAAWLDGVYFAAGDRGVAECTFSGTRADGARVHVRMVDVFTFRDGRILVKNAFRKDRPPLTAG